MARYLFGSVAKAFQQKRKTRRVRKAKALADRQKNFRKGFVHKDSTPKSFDSKITLPTHGTNRRMTLRRRIKERV